METNILNQIIGNSSHDHDRINGISESDSTSHDLILRHHTETSA